MLRLMVLGALGYAGYRYFQNSGAARTRGDEDRVAVAGGPISDEATIVHTPPA